MTPQQIQQIEHCIFRETHDAFFVINPPDLKIVEANPAAQRISRLRRQQLLSLRMADLFEVGDSQSLEVLIQACQTTSSMAGGEGYLLRTPAGPIPANVAVSRIHTDPDPLALLTVRDVSERRRAEAQRARLEQQLQHSQKLECLGLMAGGIAHDFNNLLTGILGNAELADLTLAAEDPACELVQEIIQTARRASEFTHQLLAYAGQAQFVPGPLNLSPITAEMVRLLRFSISRNCELRLNLANPLSLIEGDASQIRQIVMNLIINASEAIGERDGLISISTGERFLNRTQLAGSVVDDKLSEGPYVFLEVADNGPGISAETQARVFDPFFTTKPHGRGLGLSLTLGNVRSHHGAISISSHPGHGTAVRIYFPSMSTPRAEVDPLPQPQTQDAWRGSGTILVVDDQESVRRLTSRMLQKLGFSVLTAGDGQEALELYRAQGADVRVVLLDWVMPHEGGEQTLHQLRQINPRIRGVLCTGYSQQAIEPQLSNREFAGFLKKPFRLDELRRVLYAVLSEESALPPERSPGNP